MMSRFSRRSGLFPAMAAAAFALGAAGCDDSSCEGADAAGPERVAPPGAPRSAPCPPLVNVVLRTTREALAAAADEDPSRLAARICVDSRCEDLPLDAAQPSAEGGEPSLSFYLALEGVDARTGDHLAAVSVYVRDGRAPIFTAAREVSLAGSGCVDRGCGTCGLTTLAFDVPPAATPDAPCGRELVASVRADVPLGLASSTLFAEVCVADGCHGEAIVFEGAVAPAGELVEIAVPVDARRFAGQEQVVKLSLGYEPGAPIYTDARLLRLDPAALGCRAAGEPDVVFSITPDALATGGSRPPPRPLPAAGGDEPLRPGGGRGARRAGAPGGAGRSPLRTPFGRRRAAPSRLSRRRPPR